MSLVKLQDIGKDYQTGDKVISPLINLNLEINNNDRIIIYGKIQLKLILMWEENYLM